MRVSRKINYLHHIIIFICSPAPMTCDMRFEKIICMNPAQYQYHSPNEHHSIAHKREITRARY